MSEVVVSSHRSPDRIASLEAASVALLNPLISPTGDWAVQLPELLDTCADVSLTLKLSGFAKLASHIARSLRKSKPGDKDKELAGEWVAKAIAFCSGQMRAGDPEELVSIVLQWKLVARLSSAPALEKLRSRLVSESDRLVSARLRAGDRPQRIEPIKVAADEMRMMADACLDMQVALSRDDPETELALTDFVDSVQNAANALEHIGLRSLADLFRLVATRVADAVRSGQAIGLAGTQALLDWPAAWSQWFLHPAELTLSQALNCHSQVIGSRPGSSTPGEIERQLELAVRRDTNLLEVVGSRRITTQDVANPESELRVEIPADADQEVVAQLVRELPQLTGQLAECVIRIEHGDWEGVAQARRTVHTIKGAANTVGIAGIARLSHALEDLLQLLDSTRSAGSADPPDREVMGVVADASDCLADMVDRLTGAGGPTPQFQARVTALYRSVVELVHDLMPFDDEEASPQPVAGVPAPDISDFELPDLDLNNPANGKAATLVVAAPDRVATNKRQSGAQNEPQNAPTHQTTSQTTSETTNETAAAASPVVSTPPATVPTPVFSPGLQVSADVVDRLMESANQAVVMLSHLQAVIASTNELRVRWKRDSERLSQLTVELDRQVDALPVPGVAVTDWDDGAASGKESMLDPLEIERYGDLQTVSRRLSEVAADGKLLDQQLTTDLTRLVELAGKLESLQGDIREGTLAIRLVLAQSIEPRLQRVARQAARLSGKTVKLQLDGGDTAVDSDLLQRLLEPLAHLVRNAVDHGLEPVAQRVESGKNPIGTVVVSFAREATNVRVVVRDDGAGLDIASIRKRAVSLGLAPNGTDLDAAAVAQLVLAPGFSTRDKATQLSGRGIGLDVVTQALRAMRGELSIAFEAGLGASFEISLPMQVSSVPVFVVRTHTHVLAVSIRGIEKIMSAAAAQSAMRGGERLMVDQRMLEIRRLDEALGLPIGMLNVVAASPAGSAATETAEVLAIVRASGGGQTAVLMPDPGQTRQVVVRGLPPALTHIPGVDGVAILGDGAVAPVYDLPELIAISAQSAPDPRVSTASVVNANAICLVVDDSVSVRRATTSLLIDLGLQVIDVADGHEALEVMKTSVPALIITDLEMPVMNGIDLVRAVRGDERLRAVPVVMVTSRQSERHRQIAIEAGVDHFVTKPFTEDQFAALVNQLLA
ncbi:MAG: response regulator [Burkholderiaceae bacterium]